MKAHDRLPRPLLILGITAALTSTPSCGGASTQAKITIEELNRQVIVTASDTVSFKKDGPTTAEFRTGGHTFRVEAEGVLVDGKKALPIARSCREVKITVDSKTFEVQVDGDESPFAGQLK